MLSVTGIFSTWPEAALAAEALRARGFREDEINLLTPGSDPRAVPIATGEQPGLGRTIGGVTGGAAGAAVGMQILAAATTGVVPGVGPVLAVGAIAGLLAGVGGAMAGDAIETTLTGGLPRDELPLYEEALRRGCSVIIVEARDADRAEAARSALGAAGARSLDAAREAWWIGLRDAETRLPGS
jgi:hypothetical protein